MFAGHVGAVISESFMNNTHCYLEQLEWQTIYKSLSQQSPFLTDRSPLAVELRLTLFNLPGLWHGKQHMYLVSGRKLANRVL